MHFLRTRTPKKWPRYPLVLPCKNQAKRVPSLKQGTNVKQPLRSLLGILPSSPSPSSPFAPSPSAPSPARNGSISQAPGWRRTGNVVKPRKLPSSRGLSFLRVSLFRLFQIETKRKPCWLFVWLFCFVWGGGSRKTVTPYQQCAQMLGELCHSQPPVDC